MRDGWLGTGGIGRFDGDGFLTRLDRSKDLVVSGGINIFYPREIEEALLTHPDVTKISVIGRPDAEWGELVDAVVVAHGEVEGAGFDARCVISTPRSTRSRARAIRRGDSARHV